MRRRHTQPLFLLPAAVPLRDSQRLCDAGPLGPGRGQRPHRRSDRLLRSWPQRATGGEQSGQPADCPRHPSAPPGTDLSLAPRSHTSPRTFSSPPRAYRVDGEDNVMHARAHTHTHHHTQPCFFLLLDAQHILELFKSDFAPTSKTGINISWHQCFSVVVFVSISIEYKASWILLTCYLFLYFCILCIFLSHFGIFLLAEFFFLRFSATDSRYPHIRYRLSCIFTSATDFLVSSHPLQTSLYPHIRYRFSCIFTSATDFLVSTHPLLTFLYLQTFLYLHIRYWLSCILTYATDFLVSPHPLHSCILTSATDFLVSSHSLHSCILASATDFLVSSHSLHSCILTSATDFLVSPHPLQT